MPLGGRTSSDVGGGGGGAGGGGAGGGGAKGVGALFWPEAFCRVALYVPLDCGL